jgi:hypothetical protein
MLRRSLFVFLLLVMGGMAATAGYALLGLRGPEDAIEEASALYARGQFAEAIEVLDQIDRGIADRSLETRLLMMRWQAHERVGNIRRALDDITRLLDRTDELPSHSNIDQLLQRQIYFLARLGSGGDARELARKFVREHPNSSYGHVLAGEACERAYRESQITLRKRLQSELGVERERAGIDAFLEYLYRPEGDPDVEIALAALQELYCHEPRFTQAWRQLSRQLHELRNQVQEALAFHLRALELDAVQRNGGHMIPAYRGVSLALEQARRMDDLLAQAELYLSRYDHEYTVEAAIDAAKSHYDAGLYEAAIAVADRFLPRGDLAARVASGKLRATVEDLLQLKAFSLFALKRSAQLQELASDARLIREAGLGLQVSEATAAGLAGVLTNRRDYTDKQLRHVTNVYCRPDRPRPLTGKDPLDLLVPLYLQVLQRNGEPVELQLAAIQNWLRARPGSPQARHAQAKVQLDHGQYAAAMATSNGILNQHPNDVDALDVLAAAADRSYEGSGQNGEGLLRQCVSQRQLRPDTVPHPVCYLLTARAALEAGVAPVARECARIAGNAFPSARAPKHLMARAEMLADRPAEAATILASAIEADPDDSRALELWFDACQQAGLPTAQFLSQVVRRGFDSVSTAKTLLQEAVQAHSPLAAALAEDAAARPDADFELLALCAQAYAMERQLERARQLLDRAYTLYAASPRPAVDSQSPSAALAAPTQLTVAAASLIGAVATTMPDADLLAMARQELERLRPAGVESGQALVEAAAQLDRSGHRKTAFLLATTALVIPEATEVRGAKSFLLAARLAKEHGDLALAAAHYTAALTFEGGNEGAEELARLELRLGDERRMLLAFEASVAPSDPALLMLAGKLETAAALAKEQVRDNPGDLLAATALALLAEVPEGAIGAELADLLPETRQDLLELLALLREPAYHDVSLPRAEKLATTLADSPTVQLLLARAYMDHGDGSQANRIHELLLKLGMRNLPLLTEIVHSARLPGYAIPSLAREHLRTTMATAPTELTPELMVFTTHEVAGEAAAAGNQVVAATLLSNIWVRYPEISKASVFDAERLFQTGRPSDALALLAQLRSLGTEAERQTAASLMFLMATNQPELFTPIALQSIRTEALRSLRTRTLLGPPLEFLLQEPGRMQGVTPEELLQWISALLERAATGRESYRFGELALRAAHDHCDHEDLLAVVDAAVEAHPSLLPLWIERARLMASQRKAIEGIADARALLRFANPPGLVLDFVTVAAEHRSLQQEDIERIEGLPEELKDSPRGLYVRGLVALRRGQAAEAEQLLQNASPQQNGFHLFARALANLERRTPGSRATAARLFELLLADYESSSVARNAGSFARQLASN